MTSITLLRQCTVLYAACCAIIVTYAQPQTCSVTQNSLGSGGLWMEAVLAWTIGT